MNVLDTFCICKTRTCDLCFVPTVGKWGEGKFDLVLFGLLFLFFALETFFLPGTSQTEMLLVQVIPKKVISLWRFKDSFVSPCSRGSGCVQRRIFFFCDVKWPVLQLCVDVVGIWWQMFNFVFLPLKRSFQFNSRIVRTHFASIMTLNNWEIIHSVLKREVTFSDDVLATIFF